MYAVAGRIVETVSGESWESFVRTRILGPLGMRRTVLSAEAAEADSDHASPYALREGRLQKISTPRVNAIAPAAAVQSSVRDLARWLTFHATRSPALLGEGLWRELHRPPAEMPAPDQPEVQHPHYAGAPQITIRFSKAESGEAIKLFAPLNFDSGDPVEVFTRVR